MGTLAEAHEKAEQPRRGPRCGVDLLLDVDLDAEDRETLIGWLADPRMPATYISDLLAGEGHEIGADALRRHRKGQCRCDR